MQTSVKQHDVNHKSDNTMLNKGRRRIIAIAINGSDDLKREHEHKCTEWHEGHMLEANDLIAAAANTLIVHRLSRHRFALIILSELAQHRHQCTAKAEKEDILGKKQDKRPHIIVPDFGST